MTAPALSMRERRAPRAALIAVPRHAGRPEPWVTARFLVGAVVALAAAEIAIDRAGAALAAYLAPSQPAWARGVELVGSGVVGAVAVLLVVAVVLIGLAQGRWGGASLAGGAALVIAATTFTATATRDVLHIAVIVGVVALAAASRRSSQVPSAVVSAAIAVGLGQVAFLVPEFGDVAAVRLAAEAGLLLTPLLAAAAFVGAGSGRARSAAAVAAVAAAALLLARPEFAALLATWAVGATLSLPLPLYVFAAAATGFLIGGAIDDERLRPLAAGVILLWASGIAPTAVHHNLSAWLGVFLIANRFASRADQATADEMEVSCPT